MDAQKLRKVINDMANSIDGDESIIGKGLKSYSDGVGDDKVQQTVCEALDALQGIIERLRTETAEIEVYGVISARFLVKLTVDPKASKSDIGDLLANVNIPENEECKYILDTFEVDTDQNGDPYVYLDPQRETLVEFPS